MKLNLKCVPCYMNQILHAASLLTNDEKLQEKILKKALEVVKDFDTSKPAFDTFNKVQNVIRKIAPDKDPYEGLKKKFNLVCLHLVEKVKEIIENSERQFETSVRIAIAGNIIDFGKGNQLEENIVLHTIEEALEQEISQSKVKQLQRRIEEANHILYIGDNAGEIVFDKVFIERLCPEKFTFVVRGGPTLNDALMEDAKFVSMTDLVKVITTGLDLPGATLHLCSDEFKAEYKRSDLVIAKGQGNFEALSGEDKDIFFLLKIKCPVIAESFNYKYKVGDIVIDTAR